MFQRNKAYVLNLNLLFFKHWKHDWPKSTSKSIFQCIFCTNNGVTGCGFLVVEIGLVSPSITTPSSCCRLVSGARVVSELHLSLHQLPERQNANWSGKWRTNRRRQRWSSQLCSEVGSVTWQNIRCRRWCWNPFVFRHGRREPLERPGTSGSVCICSNCRTFTYSRFKRKRPL